MVKKVELTLLKDTKGSTYVNQNLDVVHDGVIDNITAKPTKASFNPTKNIKASKNIDKPPPNNKTFKNKLRNSSWAMFPK